MNTIIGMTAACIGFCVSVYIAQRKQSQKPLMCSRKMPCEQVVGSTYANMFGVRTELLGVAYYMMMIALYGMMFFFEYSPVVLRTVVAYASLVGVAFSAYLVFLQAFVIKAWCRWCLVSAAMTVVLAGLVLLSFETKELLMAPMNLSIGALMLGGVVVHFVRNISKHASF